MRWGLGLLCAGLAFLPSISMADENTPILTAILEELETVNAQLDVLEYKITEHGDLMGFGMAGNFQAMYYGIFFLLICIFFFHQLSNAIRR